MKPDEDDDNDDAEWEEIRPSAPDGPPEPKRIVSMRREGLGSRLIALTSAARTAGMIGWDYAFLWPEVNGEGEQPEPVGAPDLFFSTAFVATHVERVIGARGILRPKRVWSRRMVTAIEAKARRTGIRVPPIDRAFVRAGENVRALDPKLVDVFDALDWSAPVRVAIELARATEIEPVLAVHLRRVVPGLGTGRRAWQRGRFIPLGLIDRAVAAAREAGRQVLLTGDEREAIAWLAERHGAIDAATLRPAELSPIAATMFDLRLMMRAEAILGSNSRFARAAAVIGGSLPYDSVTTVVPPELWTRLALDHLERYPALSGPAERAATFRFLAEEVDTDPDTRRAWFAAALHADPTNDRFARGLASQLLALGQPDEAERVLEQAARAIFAERRLRSVTLTLEGDRETALAEIEAFTPAAEDPARPWTTAWLSSAMWVVGKNEDALEVAAEAARRAPLEPLLQLRHADIAFRTRHHQRAHDIYEAVAAEHPGMPAAHTGLADALLALDLPGDARTELATAMRLAPDEGRFIARYAWFGFGIDPAPETDRLAAQALAIGNDDPDVLRVLSFIPEARKDFERAVELMERAAMLRQTSLNFATRLRLLRKALAEQRDREQRALAEALTGEKADWRSLPIPGLVDTVARARAQELAAAIAAGLAEKPTPLHDPVPRRRASAAKPASRSFISRLLGRA